ncbi:WXG100 family type VII secretion target [Phytomonospora sp. NPDC050363]|uniref:WXG100 family type VII secretion target n=1 Tax=Phytomonospora sp. NPDC050363 TaxID=3155642 RepID=UPI003410167E
MSELKVDPGALDRAAGEIKSAATQLDSILDGLASKLESLMAQWEGGDQAAYSEVKMQWDKAADGLNEVLNRIGATVGQARQEYVDTELYNASRFQN